MVDRLVVRPPPAARALLTPSRLSRCAYPPARDRVEARDSLLLVGGIPRHHDAAMDAHSAAAGGRRNDSDAASAVDRVPYRLIWRQLAAGKVVPFLGAGASMSQSAGDGRRQPSGSDLSRELADEVAFPSQDDRDRTDLAKVSSYYVDLAGRNTLRELLRERLNHPFSPARIHRLLARSPRPILTVVTNYDRLLETAYEEAGVPYDVVVYTSTADQPAHDASVLWWQSEDPMPVPIEPNQLLLDLSKRHAGGDQFRMVIDQLETPVPRGMLYRQSSK